jgi:hypothetical protein
MPNWCWNNITIEGDYGTLSNMDFIMKSEGYEHAGDDDPEMGQPMRLVPMPEVLRGTRSPAPTGDYDPEGRLQALVDDPANEHWTPEHYEEDKAEHYALIERAERAEAETGYADWYSWANNEWGTKWSMEVTGYTYDTEREPEAIYISGNTAWSPPIELLVKISQKFGVKVSISYVEEGMDFIGASVIIDGVAYDSCGSFSDHLPDNWDWDNDDALEIHDDLRDRLIDHHEQVAAMQAGLVTATL